jgi:hypothetical protein
MTARKAFRDAVSLCTVGGVVPPVSVQLKRRCLYEHSRIFSTNGDGDEDGDGRREMGMRDADGCKCMSARMIDIVPSVHTCSASALAKKALRVNGLTTGHYGASPLTEHLSIGFE